MTLAPGEGRWAEALRAASLLAADPQACVWHDAAAAAAE